MKKQAYVLAVCVWVGAFHAIAAGVKLRVTGDHVNLRPAPGGSAAVASQVNAGDVLFAPNGTDGEWIEVEAPATVDLWVYGELVRDGAISASRVQIRSGAGTNYKVVGIAEKGDRVVVRGRQGDWLKIAPLPQCTLWISRDYVTPLETPAVSPVADVKPPAPTTPVAPVEQPAMPPPSKPVPQPPPVPVRPLPKPVTPLPEPVVMTARPGHMPQALASRRLVASKEQGRVVEYVGLLRPAGLVWGRPSRYRLVMRDDAGRALTLCYVLGNEAQLERIVGRTLHVTGREYWVQGVRTSVVVPEQIIRKD